MNELDLIVGEEPAALLELSGSLDAIDSLPTAGLYPGRDAVDIANFGISESLDSEVLPQDSQSGFDNRRFHPGVDHDPGEYVRGASRIGARIATPDAPYTEGESEEIIGSPGYREFNRPGPILQYRLNHPELVFFTDADRVKICADRKRRREILASKGLLGRFYRPKYRNPYSKVRCD